MEHLHSIVTTFYDFKRSEEFSSAGWVFYTGHNDFGNAFFLQRYQGWGNTLQAHTRSILEKSQIYRWMRSKGQPWIVPAQQLDPHNQFEGDGIDQARRIHIEHDYLYNMRRILWLSEKEQIYLYYDTRISLFTPPLKSCTEPSANLFRKLKIVPVIPRARYQL